LLENQKTTSMKSKILRIKSFPTTWNELSPDQLEKVAKLFHGKPPGLKFEGKLFRILVGYRWWQIGRMLKARFILSQVPMSILRGHFEFIYKEVKRTSFVPTITIGKVVYYAPMDRISNLTVNEFSVADDLHIAFRESKNIEYLHYLAAVLYTPETEPRPMFDKNNLPHKADKFKKVPLKKLLAMELAYMGCKNHIANKYKRAFPKMNPESQKKPSKKQSFGKVIRKMTQGDLSKLEAINNVNVYVFMDQFEEDLTPKKK